jgi:hypothetical protein
MFETSQFGLPLLQASQAQKHITVNEAIARLDAVAQLRMESMVLATAPTTAEDGEAYLVPIGATDDWHGQDNKIAIFSNNSWTFLTTKVGWKAWIVDEAKEKRFDGSDWVEITSGTGGGTGSADLTGPLGSSFGLDMLEFEHVIAAGSSNATVVEIPAGSMVAMVAFRVGEEIVTDGATSWRFGISNSITRYGSNYGLSVNSNDVGGENKTMFYYPSAKQLYLTPSTGNFISGKVIFTIYVLKFGLPNAI